MTCTDAATISRPQQRACSVQSLLKITGGIDASVPDGSAYDGFSSALKAPSLLFWQLVTPRHFIHSSPADLVSSVTAAYMIITVTV